MTPNCRAFTLIEILVTLVVIGIAAVALMSLFANQVRGSADPMIQQQGITIAEAYLEEILLRAFDDPDDPESGADEGEATRGEFDDVKDYRSLASVQASNQPRDQFGALIPGLTDYAVTVVVDGSGADASLNGIAAETDALRIDVTVTHPAISPLTLSGFRTRYPP